MTLTTSVSEFRNNIAEYLNKVSHGDTVLIKDEKKDAEIAQVTGYQKFDKESYIRALRGVAGIFTTKNHPEWSTKAKVEKWLRQSRLSDERNLK